MTSADWCIGIFKDVRRLTVLFFVAYPIFAVAVLTGVRSVLWKVILIAATGVAFFYPPFNIVVPVASIIGIAIVGSLRDSGLM